MSAGDLSLSCLSVLMHARVCVCVGFYVGAGNLKEVRGRAFYAGRATTSCYRGSHAVRTSWLKLLSSLLCVCVYARVFYVLNKNKLSLEQLLCQVQEGQMPSWCPSAVSGQPGLLSCGIVGCADTEGPHGNAKCNLG